MVRAWGHVKGWDEFFNHALPAGPIRPHLDSVTASTAEVFMVTVPLGSPITAEDVLRFLHNDINSRAGFVGGTVALEFVVRLQPKRGAAIPLRIKVWEGNEAAEPFNWITSHFANTPMDQHFTPKSNTYGASVIDALTNAVHSVLTPINLAIADGHEFRPEWLEEHRAYDRTP